MAEFRLALGGVVDVATPAEIDSAITGLQGHVDQQFETLKRGGSKFTWRTISAAVSSPFSIGGSLQLTMVPASPAVGKVWSVRRVTITGGDDHSTVAGITAALYAGDPYNLLLTQCIIPGQILPYFNTFGTGSMPVHDTEQLFFNVVSSATIAFQEIAASITVIEWDESQVEKQYA